MDDRALERGKELGAGLRRHRADDPARHQEAKGVDRIGGVRHQHDVARRGDRLGHVGETFLRAERRHDLRIRIELDPEPARIIAGLGAAQASNPLRGRIAVGARLADRFDELVDHMLGRGQVGIAHAEIDDIGAPGSSLGLERVDLLEDIRRQTPHAVKIAHRSPWPWVLSRFSRPTRRFGSVASEGQERQTG